MLQVLLFIQIHELFLQILASFFLHFELLFDAILLLAVFREEFSVGSSHVIVVARDSSDCRPGSLVRFVTLRTLY